MNRCLAKTFVFVSGIIATGVCVAQAPVVDVQDTANDTVTASSQALDTVSSGPISSFELEQRLLKLEQIVDSRTESQQRMSMQIMELQNDIAEIRGSIELQNHQLEQLLETQKDLYKELESRFQGMQAQTDQLGDEIVNGSSASTTSLSGVASEQDLYDTAVNLILKQKDYDSAIPAFQNFLNQYPNSNLTANAHYWLGQLLFNQQKYSEAKAQFSQVADKFTNSPKRADSLLKLGLIEKSTGNISAANNFFQQVINEYASGSEAKLAKQQLTN